MQAPPEAMRDRDAGREVGGPWSDEKESAGMHAIRSQRVVVESSFGSIKARKANNIANNATNARDYPSFRYFSSPSSFCESIKLMSLRARATTDL
jgi:hypothetical protein